MNLDVLPTSRGVAPPSIRTDSGPQIDLSDRIERARHALKSCNLCELRCGADRTRGQPCPCGAGDQTWIRKRHVSFAEELELSPSYMVYLGACNLRCRFCVQAPGCFGPRLGERVEPSKLGPELAHLVADGVVSINLLGGEPSLHPHTILELAHHAPRSLPLVLNSNMYMTSETIELLDGVVSTWLADYKFGNNSCALELSGVERYVETVQRNLLDVKGRGSLVVRHLLMPGHLECCFLPVARFVARELRHVRFTLMTGYVPAWRTNGDPGPMGNAVSASEQRAALAHLDELGLGGATE